MRTLLCLFGVICGLRATDPVNELLHIDPVYMLRHVADQFTQACTYSEYYDMDMIAKRNALHNALFDARILAAQCRLMYVDNYNCEQSRSVESIYRDSLYECAYDNVKQLESMINQYERVYKHCNREVARRDLVIKLRYILQRQSL